MSETQTKIDQIRIRISRDEKTALVEAARKRGQSVSELLRAAAHREAEVAA